MRATLILTAFLCGVAQQVAALSCGPANAVETVKLLRDSDHRYRPVVGQFSAEGARPARDLNARSPDQPDLTWWATFTGMALSTRGFDVPIEARVRVTEICMLGQWCGSLSTETRMLAFLTDAGGHYAIATGPCDAGGGFVDPTPHELRRVLGCARGGACNSTGLDRW